MRNFTKPLAMSTLLTLTEAGAACGVAVDSMRHARRQGKFPNAVQREGDGNGTDLVPVADLINAGYLDPAAVDQASATVDTSLDLRIKRVM